MKAVLWKAQAKEKKQSEWILSEDKNISEWKIHHYYPVDPVQML